MPSRNLEARSVGNAVKWSELMLNTFGPTTLRHYIDNKFVTLEELMDTRFLELSQSIDARFTAVNQHFLTLEQSIDQRFLAMNQLLDTTATAIMEEVNKKATILALNQAVTDLTTEINKGVTTADTPTIDFTGTGRNGSVLKADVKLAQRTGNRLVVDDAGGLGVFDTAPPNLTVQWVDAVNGNDTNDGTRTGPLKTVYEAVHRIYNAGGIGSYNIWLKAGQTHVMNKLLDQLSRATLTFAAYDDPKYRVFDFDGGPGYYWWSAPDFQRPSMDFQLIPHPDYPQYTAFPVIDAGTLYMQGINLLMPTGAATLPGYPWYVLTTENNNGRIWNQGCDYTYRGSLRAVARGGAFWNQNCRMVNFSATLGVPNFLGDSMGTHMIGGDGDYEYSMPSLSPNLPTFQGRRTNQHDLLRPWNLCNGAAYNLTTRTLFGTNVNYDIFTSAPVGSPSPAPVGSPSPAPVGSPSPAPVGSPAPAPVGSPAPAPVGSPAPAPVGSPVGGPVIITPVGSPAPAPVGSPVG